MVAATMKISEYVILVYSYQTGIANWSILVKKHCFIAQLIYWPWEGDIQHEERIIYNFITLDSISTATTITKYCRIAYASNMFIWTKFMTPYQNVVLPLKSVHSQWCKRMEMGWQIPPIQTRTRSLLTNSCTRW